IETKEVKAPVKTIAVAEKIEPNVKIETKEVKAPVKTIAVAEKTEPNVKVATKEVKAPAKTIIVTKKTENNIKVKTKEIKTPAKAITVAENAATIPNQSTMSPQEEDYIQMAEVYFDSNEFDKSIEYLDTTILLNPSNSKAYYLLAQNYFELDNMEKARENIIKAINLIPNSKEFLDYQQKIDGKDSSLINDKDRTVSYQDANDAPLDSEYYNKKGIEYIKYQDYEKAESYFLKSIELKQDFYEAYNNLAYLSLNEKKYTQAVKYAENALKFKAEYPEALYNIAFAYKQMNDNSKAITYLNKTIVADPKFDKAYYLKALIYLNAKDNKKAKENLLNAVKYNNDFYEANYNLAVISANEANMNDAILYMGNASKNDKDNGQASFYLGLFYESLNDNDLANNAFQSAVNKNFKDENLFIQYANSLMASNNYEKALEIADIGLGNNKSSHELYNIKGMALINLKNLDYAVDAYRKAIELNEKRPIYHYNLSQCSLLMENQGLSSTEFQKAIAIKPVYVQDYIDLTSIYIDRGMKDYAISTTKDGLKTFPKDTKLNLILSQLLEDNAQLKDAKILLKNYNKINDSAPLKAKLEEKINYLNRF
ncbi:MAG: tetratricopeptide repeat protein, partial [bacterium]